jgi:hypothetical protein
MRTFDSTLPVDTVSPGIGDCRFTPAHQLKECSRPTEYIAVTRHCTTDWQHGVTNTPEHTDECVEGTSESGLCNDHALVVRAGWSCLQSIRSA